MPCYDPSPEERAVSAERARNRNFEIINYQRIDQLNNKIKFLQGALCAVITELENRSISNDVISQASKSGLIDIMSFWKDHKKDDVTRLANEIHKYSEHEQAIILKLLTKQI